MFWEVVIMKMVRHNTFGLGEVIGKNVISGVTYLKVRFEDGTQKQFCIPKSFETGALEALGDFKAEVEQITAERNALIAAEATKAAVLPKYTEASSKPNRTATSKSKPCPTGPVADDFEKYLIDADYKVETDDGAPSTVYSYLNAVESVRVEEGMSWDTLADNIDDIILKYDEGGPKADFGAKSNKTVINALKRFGEYVLSANP